MIERINYTPKTSTRFEAYDTNDGRVEVPFKNLSIVEAILNLSITLPDDMVVEEVYKKEKSNFTYSIADDSDNFDASTVFCSSEYLPVVLTADFSSSAKLQVIVAAPSTNGQNKIYMNGGTETEGTIVILKVR